jgi:pimeloyl-ACP methyl ester carboxylesterase
MKSVELVSAHYEHPFHLRVGGCSEAPVVVLLHGHMAHSIAFRRVWARFGTRFRLLIPDLPGHGADSTFRDPRVQPRMEAVADWFLDFLSAGATYLGENPTAPVHLVGHSLGASVAHEVARREPGRFSTVSLVSPGFCVRVPPGAARFLELLPPPIARLAMNRRGMRFIEPFRWQGLPMSADELDAYLEPLKDLGRLEFSLRLGADLLRDACKTRPLAPLNLPTQLIFGGLDTVVDIERADAIARQLAAARHDLIPTAGHSPPEDAPAEFTDAVFDFIDEFAP